MLRTTNLAVLATTGLALACATEPESSIVRSPVILGVDHAIGRQALDSVYWYSGYRPESLVVAKGIVHLAMPAGSLGHRVEMLPQGCQFEGAPFGVVRSVARQAWRNVGSRVGADTVIVTVPGPKIERETWLSRRTCGPGRVTVRLDPDRMRGDK